MVRVLPLEKNTSARTRRPKALGDKRPDSADNDFCNRLRTREGTPMRAGHMMLLALLGVAGCEGKKQLPHEGKSVAELEKMLASDDPAVQAQGALGLSRQGA